MEGGAAEVMVARQCPIPGPSAENSIVNDIWTNIWMPQTPIHQEIQNIGTIRFVTLVDH